MQDITILLFRSFLYQVDGQRYLHPSICTKHAFSAPDWDKLLSVQQQVGSSSGLIMKGDVKVEEHEIDYIQRLYQAAILLEYNPKIVTNYPMPLYGQMFDNIYEQVGGRHYSEPTRQGQLGSAITKLSEYFIKTGINIAQLPKRDYYVLWVVFSIAYDRLKLTTEQKLNHADRQDIDDLLKHLEKEKGIENVIKATLGNPTRFVIQSPPLATEDGVMMKVVAQELDATSFDYPLRIKAYMY